ncbi:hypothetical protein CAPTEDRAFT_205608 [Capitella teleta]|uniref:LIM zinc-binding domain-containing protein n=1 Tax=Capitella teleta TaxID=283909 RepID=R7U5R2_CAPTE|nr:hypothetical protein CAPTEDRAFT_205608 [Capitella teleta]|eukprot:ELT98490.1 hypothetical protein CAPTEDRAFT_205608 [Capitella teleta]
MATNSHLCVSDDLQDSFDDLHLFHDLEQRSGYSRLPFPSACSSLNSSFRCPLDLDSDSDVEGSPPPLPPRPNSYRSLARKAVPFTAPPARPHRRPQKPRKVPCCFDMEPLLQRDVPGRRSLPQRQHFVRNGPGRHSVAGDMPDWRTMERPPSDGLQRTLERRSYRKRREESWEEEICHGCGFEVQHDRVSVQGAIYHRSCFKCTSSKSDFPSVSLHTTKSFLGRVSVTTSHPAEVTECTTGLIPLPK